MSHTAVAFCCLGMRKFYLVGGFAPPGEISLTLTASLATAHRRILAAFRQKIGSPQPSLDNRSGAPL
jgi:hypothetical protein